MVSIKYLFNVSSIFGITGILFSHYFPKKQNKIRILALAAASMLLFAGCERHRLFDNARNDASSFVNVGTAPPAFTYYLVVLGGNTGRTSIYDPETNTFSAGPIL